MQLFEVFMLVVCVIIAAGTAMFILIPDNERRNAGLKWLKNFFWGVVILWISVEIILIALTAILGSLVL